LFVCGREESRPMMHVLFFCTGHVHQILDRRRQAT
jgi:hypothetical protein